MHPRRSSPILLAWLLAASPLLAHAQGPETHTLHGEVRAGDGAPLSGANAFLLETLDGALTDDAGRFAIRTAHRGEATLVVRRIGFRPIELEVTLPRGEPLVVQLRAEVVSLSPVTVEAGRWTAGNERGATLTTLEVVSTPGAAANINRAIQTLPGTQSVDEGTALFVRGGDYTETKVLLDGAVLPGTPQLRTPTGTFTGTVDPFLLDGIVFSSGGFGARYGNALSGIVALRTAGRAARTSSTLSAGLAAQSGSAALALPHRLSVRAAANRFDLDPFLRLNGNHLRYAPAPTGHDGSASAIWSPRESGELKLFVIDQRMRLGVRVNEASHGGTFDVESASGVGVLSWRDRFGAFWPSVSLSRARLREHQHFGAFLMDTRLRSTQTSAMVEWQRAEDLTITLGGEWARTAATFAGAIPERGDDVAPGAPVAPIAYAGTGDRDAAFAELAWRFAERVSVTGGIRTDHSTLTDRRTADPRLSVSVVAHPRLTLTGAWGVYHQIPDPLLFEFDTSGVALPPMRAEQLVFGAQLETTRLTARAEAYRKTYRDLALFGEDHEVRREGRGRSAGVDVWVKGRIAGSVDGRLAYSLVSARRTNDETGEMARAPFDVTHSMVALVERRWSWLMLSAAYRHATGRPFTPVTDAARDHERGVWHPIYGAPMSERLPAYHRLDVSAAHLRRLGESMQLIVFWSMANILDRRNVHAYRWSSDYAERFPVRSMFDRSHYFGVSLTLLP